MPTQNYLEGYNLGYEMGVTGKSYPVGDQPADYREGLQAGLKGGSNEQARYGGFVEAIKFGTPTESAKAQKLSGISPELAESIFNKTAKPAYQIVETPTQKYKEKIGYELPLKEQSTITNIQLSEDQMRKLLAMNINPNLPPQKSTILNYGKKSIIAPLITEPSIIKTQTGSFKGIETGYKEVPKYSYTFVEPPESEGLWKQTPATEEQIKYYEAQQRILSEKMQPVAVPIDTTDNLYNTIQKSLRYSLEPLPAEEIGKGTTNILKKVKIPKQISEFTGGLIGGTLEDIKEQPIKNIAELGLGAGLGIAFKGGAKILGAIPKIGKELSVGYKMAAIGYGVYETGKTIGQTIDLAGKSTPYEAGKLIGITIKDLGLIGYGFKYGEKGVDILKGEIRNFGLKELPVKKGIYPQAPINKQLELFEKNIYKEVSENPIAFHTTPDIFYKEEIIPKKGSSELAGLYVSTQISTPFTQLEGSGAKIPKDMANFIKSISELFYPEKDAGVAGLEPLGFREVKIGYSKVKQFEGQKYIKGRGYAYYKTEPKLGMLDIPKIKSEIEAIAREESGGYEFTGKRFYTKVSGVKIPIDIFKYNKELSEKQFQKNLDKDIELVNKNYAKLMKYKEKTELTKGHGGKHLYAVKSNVARLIEAYPELSKELIENYGSINKAKIELENAALVRDLAKFKASSAGEFHGQRMAKVLRSGKSDIILGERAIKAIEYHEKTYGATTAEEKILSTADRLDFVRFNQKVKSELLPLKDALQRLNKETKEVIITEKKLSSSKIYESILGKDEKGITFEEFSQEGKDFTRNIIKQQAKSEADLLEINFGKIKPKQKEIFIERRSDKLLEEYKESLRNEKNKIDKKVIPEKKIFKPSEYSSYKPPRLYEGLLHSGEVSIKSEISSLSGSISGGLSSSIAAISSSISASSIQSSIISNMSSIKYSRSSNISGITSKASYKSGKSSAKSSISDISSQISEITIPKPSSKKQQINMTKQRRSLGQGYDVYGKILKGKSFFKINSQPLTKQRALDVGTFYVSESLARTYKIKKSGQALEDYQFMYIPFGYYQSKAKTLRVYKIRKGEKIDIGQQFIQKAIYALDTQAERKQIQEYKKLAKSINRKI